METKRVPRSQFLKLTMENKKKLKKEYREWMQHQEN